MKKHTQKEIQIIENLHRGHERGLSEGYNEYRSYFMRWARKQFPLFTLDRLEDTYQNAWIVFIEKFIHTNRIRVKDGNIIGLTTSIQAFLTTIGYNMLKNFARTDRRMPFTSIEVEHQEIGDPDNSDEEKEISQVLVREAFEMLKEKEKDVIFFKYVLNYSYEEIRITLGLESADSLRSLCARYMKKFRSNFKQLNEDENELGKAYLRSKTDSDNQGMPSDSFN